MPTYTNGAVQCEFLPSPENARTLRITWVSDSSLGTVIHRLAHPIKGELHSVQTFPDQAAAPTDNYDITLKDDFGFDVLQGILADRDTANPESETVYEANSATTGGNPYVVTLVRVDGLYTFNVTNAGNSKKGVTLIYLR